MRVVWQLAKGRLAVFVALSTAAGSVAAQPSAPILPTLVGTTLCIAAANTLNQLVEAPFDAQMARTMARPLPRAAIGPAAAFAFAVVCSISGPALLLSQDPRAAALGFGNILLYAACYTPLKRVSAFNTWLGALVGAVPPLIGWCATSAPFCPSAFILPAILFSWQMPHFAALAWLQRHDYSRAGYQMAAVLSPLKCARSQLYHSLFLTAFPPFLVYSGLCSPLAYLSLLPNFFLSLASARFYRLPNRNSARKLFSASLLHLPCVMATLCASL